MTPTSTPPDVINALAPDATTSMSAPCFVNAKSPLRLASPPSVARNPITSTVAVFAPTFTGALNVPTLTTRSTAALVLLYDTVTRVAPTEANDPGNVTTGVPDACSITPPVPGNTNAN